MIAGVTFEFCTLFHQHCFQTGKALIHHAGPALIGRCHVFKLPVLGYAGFLTTFYRFESSCDKIYLDSIVSGLSDQESYHYWLIVMINQKMISKLVANSSDLFNFFDSNIYFFINL